jgi:hypothetical protein
VGANATDTLQYVYLPTVGLTPVGQVTLWFQHVTKNLGLWWCKTSGQSRTLNDMHDYCVTNGDGWCVVVLSPNFLWQCSRMVRYSVELGLIPNSANGFLRFACFSLPITNMLTLHSWTGAAGIRCHPTRQWFSLLSLGDLCSASSRVSQRLVHMAEIKHPAEEPIATRKKLPNYLVIALIYRFERTPKPCSLTEKSQPHRLQASPRYRYMFPGSSILSVIHIVSQNNKKASSLRSRLLQTSHEADEAPRVITVFIAMNLQLRK